MTARLIICHGLPGSGKSTWAQSFVSENSDFIRINRDDIRLSLAGASYFDHRPVAAVEKIVQNEMKRSIREAFQKGLSVVSDDTNLNIRTIAQLASIARTNGASVEQKHFDVPVETCKERNRKRAAEGGRFVPEDVIDAMARKSYRADGHIGTFVIDRGGRVSVDTGENETAKSAAEDFSIVDEDSETFEFPVVPRKGGSYAAVIVPEPLLALRLVRFRKFVGNGRAKVLEDFRRNRDGKSYHMTVITPSEMRQIGPYFASEALSDARLTLTLGGIGKAVEDGREAFYVIVSSSSADALRASLGLPSKDYHITIGFDRRDVFSVVKDSSTEVSM